MTEAEARAVLHRFRQLADQFADCFGRRDQRDVASRYLAGLVNDSARESMQAMRGRLSDAGTYQALQRFITDSPWPAGPMWTRLREVIPDRRGVLAVDDTGFPKQGTHAVDVKRQYCGALGETGNCQVAVTTATRLDRVARRADARPTASTQGTACPSWTRIPRYAPAG